MFLVIEAYVPGSPTSYAFTKSFCLTALPPCLWNWTHQQDSMLSLTLALFLLNINYILSLLQMHYYADDSTIHGRYVEKSTASWTGIAMGRELLVSEVQACMFSVKSLYSLHFLLSKALHCCRWWCHIWVFYARSAHLISFARLTRVALIKYFYIIYDNSSYLMSWPDSLDTYNISYVPLFYTVVLYIIWLYSIAIFYTQHVSNP